MAVTDLCAEAVWRFVRGVVRGVVRRFVQRLVEACAEARAEAYTLPRVTQETPFRGEGLNLLKRSPNLRVSSHFLLSTDN